MNQGIRSGLDRWRKMEAFLRHHFLCCQWPNPEAYCWLACQRRECASSGIYGPGHPVGAFALQGPAKSSNAFFSASSCLYTWKKLIFRRFESFFSLPRCVTMLIPQTILPIVASWRVGPSWWDGPEILARIDPLEFPKTPPYIGPNGCKIIVCPKKNFHK